MTRAAVVATAWAALCLSCIAHPDAALGQSTPVPGNRAAAIAASSESRIPSAADLPELKCHLHRREPVLDFEFRFYAPFWIEIPLRRLHGGGQRLSTTAIVRPVSVEGAEAVRIEDTYELAKAVPKGIGGNAELNGAFALGEGRYEIDWKIEDEAGRSCELSWRLEAKLSKRHRHVNLSVKPGEVTQAGVYLFRPERPARTSGSGLRIKLLMNLDIRTRRRSRVQLWRYAPMISGLRVMSRHEDLSEFGVVAFSLEDQRVLHRQGLSRRIDFPELGDAIESLNPATVEFNTLRKGSDLAFLDTLLADELSDTEQVDAIVFVGADDRFGKRVSPETLEQIRARGIPVFHFNSTYYLWRGAIGNAVRSLGGKEYKVRQPHELARAVEELVGEILACRPEQRSGL
jgi:hypothetical protein